MALSAGGPPLSEQGAGRLLSAEIRGRPMSEGREGKVVRKGEE